MKQALNEVLQEQIKQSAFVEMEYFVKHVVYSERVSFVLYKATFPVINIFSA